MKIFILNFQEQQPKQTTSLERSIKKKKKKVNNAGLIIPTKSEQPKSIPKKSTPAFANIQLKNLFTKSEENVSTMCLSQPTEISDSCTFL